MTSIFIYAVTQHLYHLFQKSKVVDRMWEQKYRSTQKNGEQRQDKRKMSWEQDQIPPFSEEPRAKAEVSLWSNRESWAQIPQSPVAEFHLQLAKFLESLMRNLSRRCSLQSSKEICTNCSAVHAQERISWEIYLVNSLLALSFLLVPREEEGTGYRAKEGPN